MEKSDEIIKNTIEKIKNGDVEVCRITKTVLVIDEAQDMNEDEFNLIKTLMEENEEMRVIAVGDDDQNIFEFRGASSKYLGQFVNSKSAVKYELLENYRSKSNLVEFSNQFAKRIQDRLKFTPVIAKQNDNGIIKIVQYRSKNLFSPLVNDILETNLTGTTCVLTKTNDEALQITGLLLRNKIKAKLIQSNEGFDLFHLAEIRHFIHLLNFKDDVFVINDDTWDNAKREFRNLYQRSSNLEICNNLIHNFEITNPKMKYKSDFEVFIRESKLEDFFDDAGETIVVSTIHKAKGKEFDNVFLMLDNYDSATESGKRSLYVAMTRAKQNLTIHSNTNQFEDIRRVHDLQIHFDENEYDEPKEMTMNLNYKDVWLDYFINKQYEISKLLSGDELIYNGIECLNNKRKSVLKFSNQFNKQMEDLNSLGYTVKGVNVNFIVYWKKEETDEEVKIILPVINFEKQ